MASPVTVPRVQTTNKDVNQLQTNIINAMQTVGQDLSTVIIIGEVKLSPLTETQFQAQVGSGWVLCDGRSAISSSYNHITGHNKIPLIAAVNGINSYIRIN